MNHIVARDFAARNFSLAIAFLFVGCFGMPMVNAQEVLPEPEETGLREIPLKRQPPVNTSLTSWYEAGAADTLGANLRSHWVMLGKNGELAGSVRGAAANTVPMTIFALKQGIVSARTVTDAQGNFKLDGLSEGTYTLVGYSPNSFFAYATNLLSYRIGAGNVPTRINTQAVQRGDKARIANLLQAASPQVRFATYGEYAIPEDDLSNAAHFGLLGLKNFSVDASPATTIQSRAIPLATGGVLRGRVHRLDNQTGRPLPVTQTKVMLLERGQVVVQADCNRLGVFEFRGLPAGEFSLVATGANGFAAMGIKTSGGTNRFSSKNAKSKTKLVSTAVTATSPGSMLDLSLVHDESVGWINHHLNESAFSEARNAPRPRASNYRGPCCSTCFRYTYPPERGACGCNK